MVHVLEITEIYPVKIMADGNWAIQGGRLIWIEVVRLAIIQSQIS